MPRQARTVADVVLGEAVHGSRANRFADMLGIMSVIDNRARLTGTTWQDVISAPGQFDAYGKALPPGVTAYRDLAEEAIKSVRIGGPIHTGTYYATPKATKNLPQGLVAVTATTGHRYFSDPMSRAIKTAQGVIKPAVDAAANAVQATGQALGLPSSAPTPMAAPRGLGLAALAPNGLLGPARQANVSYNMGPNRPNAPAQSITDIAQSAVTDVLGPGYSVSVISGQEGSLPQYGSNRHKTGLAADIQIKDPTGRTLNAFDDKQAMVDVAQAMAAKGATGIGIGTNYMGAKGIHVDQVQPGPGQAHTWGNIGKANADLLTGAMKSKEMPASYYEKTMPGTMAAPQTNPSPVRPDERNVVGPKGDFSVGNFHAAPVERVDRAPISAPQPAGAPSRETVSQGYGQVARTMAEAGVRGIGAVPSPQRPDNQQFAGPKGGFSVPSSAPALADLGIAPSQLPGLAAGVPPQTPTAAPKPDLAAAYGLYAQSRMAAPKQAVAPTPPPVQRPTVQQPLEVTVTQPNVVQPVAPPPAPVAAYKAALGTAAPNALGGPSGSVFGYGGQAIDAVKGGAGWAGATAYSRSNPAVSYTALGNGMVAKHNSQYGTTSYSYGGPTTSLFGGRSLGGQASRAEADRGGRGVTAGGTGLW